MAASKRDEPQTGTLARGVALAALAAVVLWTLYLARNALLIIYISGLLAIGFGPVVRAIEHQTVVPVVTRRLPRWLAILLVYIVIVGALTIVGLLVVPPLVDQAQELWTRIPHSSSAARPSSCGTGCSPIQSHSKRLCAPRRRPRETRWTPWRRQ